VGQYSISVQIQGFKQTTIEQVVLQVDQTASIRVTLQPGECARWSKSRKWLRCWRPRHRRWAR
jgi:hypothetical protein